MGFLSGAVTGLVTGAARQVNQDYAQTRYDQQQDMSRQQALVDRVAANNTAMRNQAQKVAQTQTSYQAQYNVSPDLAYTLATDPRFGNMNEQQRQMYIASLKPTGRMIPGTPAQTVTVPGVQQNNGPLGGGRINVPTQTVQASPGTPSRMGYEPATGAQLPGDNKPDNALNRTLELVARGQLDPTQAPGFYKSLGGSNPNVPWGQIHAASKDPQFQQKVSALTGQLHIPPDMATKIVLGVYRVNRDPVTGETNVIDLSTGQPVSYGSGAQPQQNQGTSTPQSQPAPTTPTHSINPQVPGLSGPPPSKPPVPPTQGQANPQQQQQDQLAARVYAQPRPASYVSKNDYKIATQTIAEAPSVLGKLNLALSMAKNDPNAMGVWAAAVKHIGGPAVSLANLLSHNLGNQVNDWFGVSKTNQFQAMMNDLKLSLTRPISADTTANRISNFERTQFADIVNNSETWTQNAQSTVANLELLRGIYYKTIASNINSMYQLPQDFASNVNAQRANYDFLTKQLKISKSDAYNIMAEEYHMSTGQGLGMAAQGQTQNGQ